MYVRLRAGDANTYATCPPQTLHSNRIYIWNRISRKRYPDHLVRGFVGLCWNFSLLGGGRGSGRGGGTGDKMGRRVSVTEWAVGAGVAGGSRGVGGGGRESRGHGKRVGGRGSVIGNGVGVDGEV